MNIETDMSDAGGGMAGLASETAAVNGIHLHYIRGGAGPAVVLVHGFPESWYEYHAIMPRLAKRITLIAIDLRGIGGSRAPEAGFDTAIMAEDIHALSGEMKVGSAQAKLPGHSSYRCALTGLLRQGRDHGTTGCVTGMACWPNLVSVKISSSSGSAREEAG